MYKHINKFTDIENKLAVTSWEKEGGRGKINKLFLNRKNK